MAAPATDRDERSLGELFGELSADTSILIRKEMELARHELTRSAQTYARNSMLVGVGGLIAYAGAIVLLMGIAWLLARLGLATDLSFLIVGAVTLAIGAVIAWRAVQSMQKVSVVPERTVETIREDVEWAKEQTQ
jgi:nitrogenase molybdenum-iron protein alpha/beta subunit